MILCHFIEFQVFVVLLAKPTGIFFSTKYSFQCGKSKNRKKFRNQQYTHHFKITFFWILVNVFFLQNFPFSINFNDSIRFDSQGFNKNVIHRMKRQFFFLFHLLKHHKKHQRFKCIRV